MLRKGRFQEEDGQAERESFPWKKRKYEWMRSYITPPRGPGISRFHF